MHWNQVKPPKPTVSVFNTDTGPKLVHPFFLAVKWGDRICTVHKISFKSALNNPVHSKEKLCSLGSWEIYTCLYSMGLWTTSPHRPFLEHSSSKGCAGNVPHGTMHRRHSFEHALYHVRIRAPVGTDGSITEPFGC